jgi:hypothetical protein
MYHNHQMLHHIRLVILCSVFTSPNIPNPNQSYREVYFAFLQTIPETVSISANLAVKL